MRRSRSTATPSRVASPCQRPLAAREYSLGLNWFPVAVVKYYAMFEHTSFSEGSGARPSENLVILRAQLAF